jgi:hypothetical protein
LLIPLEQRFEVAPLMEHEYDERAASNPTALSIVEAHIRSVSGSTTTLTSARIMAFPFAPGPRQTKEA